MKLLIFMVVVSCLANRKTGASFCGNNLCKSSKENQFILDKDCYCDDLCEFYRDCCEDYNTTRTLKEISNYGRVECVSENNRWLSMISTCSVDFSDNKNIEEDCLQDTGHPIWSVPVNGDKNGIVYRNMFCALCNGERNYTFWTIVYECKKEINLNGSGSISKENIEEAGCTFVKKKPEYSREHDCKPNIISTCLNQSSADSMKENCENGSQDIVTSSMWRSFKNPYCFNCSRTPNEFVNCLKQPDYPTRRFEGKTSHMSYFILIDFNRHKTETSFKQYDIACENNNQAYNYLNGECTQLIHPQENGEDQLNCSVTKLKEFEFAILENGTLFHNITDTLHDKQFYMVNNSETFICVDRLPVPLKYSSNEFLITIIGTSVSLISLLIFFFVFWKFQTIWNLSTWLNVSYAFSLFLAQTTFVFAAVIKHEYSSCYHLAIIMHYFFLVSFFWMNIISIFVYLSVCQTEVHAIMNSNRKTSYLVLSIYAWLIPFLFVLSARLIDLFQPTSKFAPQYGKIMCWMNTAYSIVIFFILPLSIIILLNMALYYHTIKTIIKVRKMTGKNVRHKTQTLILSIKLCLLTGVTWLVGFVGAFTKIDIIKIIFIVLNSTFGVWVTLCFLHTQVIIMRFKQTAKLIRESLS